MGSDGLHDPDREYTAFISYPYAQLRVEIGLDRGDVEWFLVQLEYNFEPEPYADNDWQQVAGFDHHPNAEWGHDIRHERLHLDVYREGRKEEVRRGFPEVEVNKAPRYCEVFLRENADELLDQFEHWHDVNSRV